MRTILIQLNSGSLGDTISVLPCVEHFMLKSNDNVLVKINQSFEWMFRESYTNINYFREGTPFDEKIELKYNFNVPLQHGYAEQLGLSDWKYIRPNLRLNYKERPIKGKYVVINIHSTCQLKYWNHPFGIESQPSSPNWTELCGMLRKEGLTPVIIEKDEMFGTPPYRNGIPSKANKKIGMSFEDVINYIHHSEFFIGLSSGLSWLSHAMNKKVVMIANFTEDWNEFDLSCRDYKRITNKSVCHGCWNKIGDGYDFDPNDWYWCPKHKGTDRQFECHTSITPLMVFDEIKDWIN